MTLAKAALRQNLLAARAALPPSFRQAAAQKVAQLLPPLLAGREGNLVAGYVPVRGEIDPEPALVALVALGYRLALPVVAGKTLTFHAFGGEEETLAPGAYGIPAPPANSNALQPDIILTPLLAFTAEGHRLGYGGGYYDRALVGRNSLHIGLAFAVQQADFTPEPHDIRLHAIVTETGVVTPP